MGGSPWWRGLEASRWRAGAPRYRVSEAIAHAFASTDGCRGCSSAFKYLIGVGIHHSDPPWVVPFRGTQEPLSVIPDVCRYDRAPLRAPARSRLLRSSR